MEWLTDNPLANMSGPSFLLLYAVVIITTLIVCRTAIRQADWTSNIDLPKIPTNPDPYEIAYMRGGENEVICSVIFSLVQRGLLKMIQVKNGNAYNSEGLTSSNLTALEGTVLSFFLTYKTTKDIFKDNALANIIRPYCNAYEDKLRHETLLMPEDVEPKAKRYASIAAFIIIGLGSFKLFAALAHGRFNVIFLIIMAVIAFIAFHFISRVPRLSKRGKLYLENLRLAFARLKNQQRIRKPTLNQLENNNQLGFAAQQPAAYPTVDPMLLMVGVFGIGTLAETNYGYLSNSLRNVSVKETGPSCAGCGGSYYNIGTIISLCRSGDSSSCSSSSSGSSCNSDGGSSCSSDGGSCSGGSSCGGGGCGGGCGG